jgi:hypothetical protein
MRTGLGLRIIGSRHSGDAARLSNYLKTLMIGYHRR